VEKQPETESKPAFKEQIENPEENRASTRVNGLKIHASFLENPSKPHSSQFFQHMNTRQTLNMRKPVLKRTKLHTDKL